MCSCTSEHNSQAFSLDLQFIAAKTTIPQSFQATAVAATVPTVSAKVAHATHAAMAATSSVKIAQTLQTSTSTAAHTTLSRTNATLQVVTPCCVAKMAQSLQSLTTVAHLPTTVSVTPTSQAALAHVSRIVPKSVSQLSGSNITAGTILYCSFTV